MIWLRREERALGIGDYIPVQTKGDLLAYRREHNNTSLLIVLNLGDEDTSFTQAPACMKGRIIPDTNLKRKGELVHGRQPVKANEGLVIKLQL
ncbi:hypothetical protein [Pontibacter pudoricolor]|uniref:hypothetical protein n=1 Tax=Pontibacter pudoricolor TaxID=2694930 RepID=UPI00293BEB19|nr:hypothetical protein [Pontibacter pudoricolor]